MNKISLAVLSAIWLSGCALDASNGSEGEDNSAGQATETSVSDVKLANPALGGPGTLAPHCVAQVSSNAASCFSTFREAITFATGGKIVDAPEAKVALADENFVGRINSLAITPNTTVVIGIDYVDANFQGATFIWSAASGCDGDLSTNDFSVSSLSPFGWNDVISSFRSFSNCETVLFEHDNFGGATTQLAVDLSNVGDAMNDRASSIKWF